MAFVSLIPRTDPSIKRRVVTCTTKKPRIPRRRHSRGDPSKNHVAKQQRPRSAQQESDAELIGESSVKKGFPNPASRSAEKDVWDTLIDDHTILPDVVQPPQSSSPDRSTASEGLARMAARPSNKPKPTSNSESEGTSTSKKKRGRPKRSKSKAMSEMPAPPVSPFISAMREKIRQKDVAAARDMLSGALETQAGESINMNDVNLSAPNGLPTDDEASKDLLFELLPIIAAQENEETRVITDEEKRIKDLIATCYTQFNSIHRSSERLDNLKPFKTEAKDEKTCKACDGAGMIVCEYCDGQGYVDLGENGEKFNPKYGDNEFAKPKHVMANIYHCPLCGGSQRERCVSCFGTGTASGAKKVMSREPSGEKDDRAWKIFDMDELMRQEADRIEIGLDGTIILRAQPRTKSKKSKKEGAKVKPLARRGRRGRPSKSATAHTKNVQEGESSAAQQKDEVESPDILQKGVDLHPEVQTSIADSSVAKTTEGDENLITTPGPVGIPKGLSAVRSTDFVNTTDYQVGRRLQKQASSKRQGFPDSKTSANFAAQDRAEEEEMPGDSHA